MSALEVLKLKREIKKRDDEIERQRQKVLELARAAKNNAVPGWVIKEHDADIKVLLMTILLTVYGDTTVPKRVRALCPTWAKAMAELTDDAVFAETFEEKS